MTIDDRLQMFKVVMIIFQVKRNDFLTLKMQFPVMFQWLSLHGFMRRNNLRAWREPLLSSIGGICSISIS